MSVAATMSTAAGSIAVRRLQPADHARWDAFVAACPEATFFHRAGWAEVLQRAFGHDAHFLYAERDGVIVGVLPLGHLRSRLFGNALISVPFCVYGGIAATDEEVRRPLADAACRLAQELGVDYLELRHRRRQFPDWPCKDGLYVTFRKPILPDEDANLKAIPRKQRAMVRKGIEAGLEGRIEAGVDNLFLAYSESVRNLGTPVLPKRYFQVLREVFGSDCEVLTIRQGETLVASVLSFYFRDEVLPYYGGGTAQAREVKGNDFMYWDLLRRSCARGLRLFDYGRSKNGTGSYSFKKNWGFEPEPLYYEFHLVRATQLPDINPLNPKYRLFIAAWQRLPLWLSRRLGPWLARSLG
ncbi:FemAB family XrtA/PEP-CTERM system-associated protein [Plasticicumulans sp.]|uniref:FemAB family XrtA/PEP-CTERM system-associated protein n=1 Tax=Plasticicumulans sp. TaxID=2307179 RepID=UPI002C5CEA5D|nr:FemAB family XrtA/PEP-CTERM system-associated protein [Plasticicumulans sp.]HNJ07446.1 FemAB family PEP-CTERM system-associated protein [Plasticicumulans sp.]HNK30886.1 FemAB family PEP-CTERM system-associated protein [Plasticicumulans sp.]HNM42701.1 FemAB family PEP-CTERM system-associated protein [Plasticicumulans sp.]